MAQGISDGEGTRLVEHDQDPVAQCRERLVAEPGVRDAVVLGIGSGQAIAVQAVLLLEEGADAAAIVTRANRRLASPQQIRRVTVWPEESFPLTPTRKIKRADVVARIAERQAQSGSATRRGWLDRSSRSAGIATPRPAPD